MRYIEMTNIFSHKKPLQVYPPGSKSEALRLGVHVILLYYIRIWIFSAGTFILFWWWVGSHFLVL